MDNTQLSAWLQRGHRALHDTFPPRTRKRFAALMLDYELWNPQRLTLESAEARVGDCLNPQGGGGQSFKVSELWLWMRESGHHALFDAMADDLGKRVEDIPTEARQQQLLTRIDAKLSTIKAELDDLQVFREQVAGVLAVDPSTPVPPGKPVRFSRYDDKTREAF